MPSVRFSAEEDEEFSYSNSDQFAVQAARIRERSTAHRSELSSSQAASEYLARKCSENSSNANSSNAMREGSHKMDAESGDEYATDDVPQGAEGAEADDGLYADEINDPDADGGGGGKTLAAVGACLAVVVVIVLAVCCCKKSKTDDTPPSANHDQSHPPATGGKNNGCCCILIIAGIVGAVALAIGLPFCCCCCFQCGLCGDCCGGYQCESPSLKDANKCSDKKNQDDCYANIGISIDIEDAIDTCVWGKWSSKGQCTVNPIVVVDSTKSSACKDAGSDRDKCRDVGNEGSDKYYCFMLIPADDVKSPNSITIT